MQKVWHFGFDKEPTTIAESSRLLCEMIEYDEDLRSPIVLGKHLGKQEEQNWMQHLFKETIGHPHLRQELIEALERGEVVVGMGYDNGAPNRLIYQWQWD